ncbi:MAG TPA: uracil-DNA glycosylase [Actinomycetota bacterium]|nr:uracil-DNA glycosylase [Actinomycetota bacterium]
MPGQAPSVDARPNAADLEAIRSRALGCTACRLAEGRTQVVWAAGNLASDVLFIGEAPGFHEDKQGEPFVGAAGKLLDTLLEEIGLDRTQVAIVNVIKCRPPGNRDPLPDEIESCRPYLQAQLNFMRPKVIVTLGNFATRFIIGQPIGITKARGRQFRYVTAVVIPTFHPAAALRGGRFGGISPVDALREDFATLRQVLDRLRAEEARAPATVSGGTEAPTEQLGLF